MAILRCKQSSDWMTQNFTNSGMVDQFVLCDLFMQLACESNFPSNIGMS